MGVAFAYAPHQFFPPHHYFFPASVPAAAKPSGFLLSDFEEVAELGAGSSGTVSKVRHRASSALYALKTGEPGDPHIAAEADMLRRCADCPSIVSCHSVLRTAAGDPALLLELMDAGSLDGILRRGSRFPEAALAEVAAQVLVGLAFLHSRGIVHLDIKAANLVANAAGDVKVCDFGIAKNLGQDAVDQWTLSVGTTAYMSPERFGEKPPDYDCRSDAYAADVWSVGVSLLELFLGRCPILPDGEKPSFMRLMRAICVGEPPSLPKEDAAAASEEFRGFVAACLQKDPRKRASVNQLLEHPFVAGRNSAACRHALRQLIAESLWL